jgi:ATP adenylyltransferase
MKTMTNDCFYCSQDDQLQNLMIKISDLSVSNFYLNRDQTHPGRCILAFNHHRKEVFELTSAELHYFMDDLSKAAKAIQGAFNPDKINYGIYGDIVSHLHVHIVPKHKDGTDWGDAFTNNPESKRLLSKTEYFHYIEQIRNHLSMEG